MRAYVTKHHALRLFLLLRVHQHLRKTRYSNVLNSPLIRHLTIGLFLPLLTTVVESHVRSLSLFSFHPLLMCLAAPFFCHALILHRDKAVPGALSDIMRGTTQHKRRVLHASFNAIAMLCLLGGLVSIIANKLVYGKSLLPSSVHSLFSLLTVASLSLQTFHGVRKVKSLMASTPSRVFRYHGLMGVVTFDFFSVSLLTGLLRHLPFFSLATLVGSLAVVGLWLVCTSVMHADELVPREEEQVELIGVAEEEGRATGGGARGTTRTVL